MSIEKIVLLLCPAIALTMAVAAAVPAQTHKKLLTTRTSHHLRLSGYQTLSAARIGCGTDTVVWRASGSKVFHAAGSRYFGKTRHGMARHGMYVCRRSALADHLHAAKD